MLEIGITRWQDGEPHGPSGYASGPAGASFLLPGLVSPAFVTVTWRDTLLVVDDVTRSVLELGWQGQVRTLIHQTTRGALGGPMAACLLDDGSFLVTDRPRNQLLRLTAAGEVVWAFPEPEEVPGFGVPALLRPLDRAHVLVSMEKPGRVIKVNLETRAMSVLPIEGLSRPRGIAVTPAGEILVSDEHLHIVVRLGADRRPAEIAGRRGNPGCGSGQLRVPKDLDWVAGDPGDRGAMLIADTLNSRVLEVDAEGQERWRFGNCTRFGSSDREVSRPASVASLGSGRRLIADAVAGRLLVVGESGVTWQLKRRAESYTSLFAMPRSVQVLADTGHLLVADTYHDRVVEVDLQGRLVREFSGGELSWPRCATQVGDAILVADGRNGRIVRLDRELRFQSAVHDYQLEGQWHRFQDPHDIKLLASGHLLVTDSAAGSVVELEPDLRRAVWCAGRLADPHQAWRSHRGETYVLTSDDKQLCRLSPTGELVWVLGQVRFPDGTERAFEAPKAFLLAGRDGLVIADFRVVYEVDLEGNVRWSHGLDAAGKPDGSVLAPRWLARHPSGRLIISDTEHGRLLLTDHVLQEADVW